MNITFYPQIGHSKNIELFNYSHDLKSAIEDSIQNAYITECSLTIYDMEQQMEINISHANCEGGVIMADSYRWKAKDTMFLGLKYVEGHFIDCDFKHDGYWQCNDYTLKAHGIFEKCDMMDLEVYYTSIFVDCQFNKMKISNISYPIQ